MSFHALGLPCWSRASIESVSKSGNESSRDELSKAVRRGLNDLANGHQYQPQYDCLSTTEELPQKHGDNRADEAADVPCSDGDALQSSCVAIMVANGVNLRELLAEGRDSQKAANICLSIAECTIERVLACDTSCIQYVHTQNTSQLSNQWLFSVLSHAGLDRVPLSLFDFRSMSSTGLRICKWIYGRVERDKHCLLLPLYEQPPTS